MVYNQITFYWHTTKLLWSITFIINLRSYNNKSLKCICILNSRIYPMKRRRELMNIDDMKGSWLWDHNVHYIIVSLHLNKFLCLLKLWRLIGVNLGTSLNHFKKSLYPSSVLVLQSHFLHKTLKNENIILRLWQNNKIYLIIGQTNIIRKCSGFILTIWFH